MCRYFHTSEAARRIGIAARTMLYYERTGIISPEKDSSGRRLYTESDIDAIRRYRLRRAVGQR